jgi:hypothetical protein
VSWFSGGSISFTIEGIDPELFKIMTGESMTTPRDVDLNEWLDGIGFHPANTVSKQLGHEAARSLVALLGTHLAELLPPGRDKSLAFTALEDVLMRAERALALGGGPREGVQDEALHEIIEDARAIGVQLGSRLAQLAGDPRIDHYKAEQLVPLPDLDADSLLPDQRQPHFEATATSAAGSPYYLRATVQDFGSGHDSTVAITTACSDPAKVDQVCREHLSDRPLGPEFDGFVFTVGSMEQMSAVLRELLHVAQQAFGSQDVMPL